MLTGDEAKALAEEIQNQTTAQKAHLDQLLTEVGEFDAHLRSIQPCDMTSLALVGHDAGTNQLKFDPFLIQIVRVVDSSKRQHIRQVVSVEMSRRELDRRQFDATGNPATPVGRLIKDLGCDHLWELSASIPDDGKEVHRGWVRDFRVLAEWASLYDAVMKTDADFDRLFVVDTLLRNKMFRGDLFIKMWKRLEQHIAKVESNSSMRIRIAGFMETSQVLNRYRLALALRGTFARPEPCYAAVPKQLELQSYNWEEWARTPADEVPGGESAKFAAGKLHLAKFGDQTSDPVFAVDLPWFQADQERASETMAFLLRDARVGFPSPFVPLCLQRAREFASLEGLDTVMLQDAIMDAVRTLLPAQDRAVLARFEFEQHGAPNVRES